MDEDATLHGKIMMLLQEQVPKHLIQDWESVLKGYGKRLYEVGIEEAFSYRIDNGLLIKVDSEEVLKESEK